MSIMQIKLQIVETRLSSLCIFQHNKQVHLVMPETINLYSQNILHNQLVEIRKL